MTDEEIEKGLVHCGNGEELANCDGCPYFEKENCVDLDKDALDYINRLKAESKSLSEENDRLQGLVKENDELVWNMKAQIRKETAKEIMQFLKDRSVWFVNTSTDKDHFEEQLEEMYKQYDVGEAK